jgi:hypothetical protein
MNIYIFKNEQQYGPYTVEQLREYIQQGHFTLEDYACGDGQNWIPLSQIPGFAAQAQPGQPQQAAQPAQAQVPQVGAQVPQAQVPVATGGASKKKKIILFSSIGAVCLAAIITGLVLWLGGDDKKGGQVADADKETEQPSGESATSLADVPLWDRILADALAVARIDNGKILEKGGEGAVTMFLQGFNRRGREIFGNILSDPSNSDWDSSEPMQAFLLRHPTDENRMDLTFCLAVKRLGNAEKLKSFLGLVGEIIGEPERKNGYDLYLSTNGLSCLAVTEDLFVLFANDDKEVLEDLIAEAEKFVHSDGSDSLAKSNESFKAFTEQKHDAAIWANLEALAAFSADREAAHGHGEVPEQFTDLFEAGSGVVSLDFENGEAVLAGELQVPEGFERFGKGGLSEGALNLIPAKALAVLSLSLDMKAVVGYFENVVLPAAGDPVSLDDTIPDLGLKPRDVLETFTGEISVALTEFSMGGGGPVPSEDLPGEPEEDPFGGGGDQPAVEEDPFGGSPAPEPVTDEGFPGGPEDGPPPGGPGMGGGLPLEFIAALSVDPANWETLKAAPPLAGAMAGAMLMGISVTVKDDRLVLASKKHIAEAMEGSVQDKLAGSEQSIFKDNDFALKLDIAEAAKLEDVPFPPPVMANLKKFSYLAITGKSHEKGSSGALRIGFADKRTNSLKTLVETAPVLMKMLDGGGRVSHEDGHGDTASGGQHGLHDAAEDGDLEVIAGEISEGADIDSQMGEDGETPLHRAVTRGQLEAARFLLGNGANVNIGREKDGKTALDLAEEIGHEEIAEFLKNNGGKNSK